MKSLIGLLLLIFTWGTLAAPARLINSPINISVVPTRVSGKAPLGVLFDVSSISSTLRNNCFHDCQFIWDLVRG